jgi:hypothetical protein
MPGRRARRTRGPRSAGPEGAGEQTRGGTGACLLESVDQPGGGERGGVTGGRQSGRVGASDHHLRLDPGERRDDFRIRRRAGGAGLLETLELPLRHGVGTRAQDRSRVLLTQRPRRQSRAGAGAPSHAVKARTDAIAKWSRQRIWVVSWSGAIPDGRVRSRNIPSSGRETAFRRGRSPQTACWMQSAAPEDCEPTSTLPAATTTRRSSCTTTSGCR